MARVDAEERHPQPPVLADRADHRAVAADHHHALGVLRVVEVAQPFGVRASLRVALVHGEQDPRLGRRPFCGLAGNPPAIQAVALDVGHHLRGDELAVGLAPENLLPDDRAGAVHLRLRADEFALGRQVVRRPLVVPTGHHGELEGLPQLLAHFPLLLDHGTRGAAAFGQVRADDVVNLAQVGVTLVQLVGSRVDGLPRSNRSTSTLGRSRNAMSARAAR